jgi:hypothetical protein
MANIKDVKQLDKVTHSVRRGQVVLQYGVGAMIDFPSQVLMTALPEEWKKCETIHDERLEKLLHVKNFITPSDDGIPFVRFPQWYFCPKCRRFKPLTQWRSEFFNKYSRTKADSDPYMLKRLICSDDYQELVPARIVVVCEHGHIDDFPWVKWVHRKNRFGEKEVCASPELLFKTGSSASSGLEGVEVECKSCGAKATLEGAFSKTVFEELTSTSKKDIDFHCSGFHPWKHERQICSLFPRTMQRGAASVYFPRSVSSLVIPPYSSYLNVKIEEAEEYGKLCTVIDEDIEEYNSDEEKNEFILKKIDKHLDKISNEIHEDKLPVKEIIKRKLLIQQEDVNENVELDYKAEEYKALTGKISISNFELDEFQREAVDVDLYKIPGIKSIALIHKVKEVTALIGYSRIQPTNAMNESDEYFVSIKKPETDYYPAVSSKGEGIFIEFDKELLNKFFSAVQVFGDRSTLLNKKYKESFYGKNSSLNVDSVFLFIHTIAHLLIKELSFNCGYPTASIRERLYYGNAEGEDMCGIFLYTTGGDSEGTLGGLVRQGRSDCLTNLFKKALKSAKFCANDPVCSFSNGQGMEALNYAACHTCTLLPETCCEYANVLLDRTVLVGSMDESLKGFYSDWIK